MKRFRDVLNAMARKKHMNRVGAEDNFTNGEEHKETLNFDDQSEIDITGRELNPDKYNQIT